ncbi:MAG: transglycosylase domain-containing protein [Bradymonadia bacterium]
MSLSVKDARFDLAQGPAFGVRYPSGGPFDTRMGYTEIPGLRSRLESRGGVVTAMARWSDRLKDLVDLGLSPPYTEKSLAGLQIKGRRGELLYDAVDPYDSAFTTLSDVPPVVGEALMFFENRELLDDRSPYQNPAFELKRTAFAVTQVIKSAVKPGTKVPGGSTLATQMEKFRHADGGRTRSAGDKLKQMLSASLRAYAEGVDTTEHRQQVLVDYLNTFPLGAVPGFGEVNGLGPGLWAWFGLDLQEIGPLLERAREVSADDPMLSARAEALAHTVALLVSTRRPNAFLAGDREAIHQRLAFELEQMAKAGLVSWPLAEAAKRVRLRPVVERTPRPPVKADRKGAEAVRRVLRGYLDKADYDLDRLDLSVSTTLDVPVQQAVTQFLHRLRTPDGTKEIGLRRFPGGADPGQVHWSLTLYERRGGVNRLRVQAETSPGQFSYNDSMKLELGSTAKLRTLVSWLSLMAEARSRFEKRGVPKRTELDPRDALGRWVARWMRHCDDACTETDLMDAALERTFSANPDKWFFTGGGRHKFHNFKSSDDGREYTVRKAFARSVNLPFVRMMEEVVHHLTYADGGARVLLEDQNHPGRRPLLDVFVQQEGAVFVRRFWRRHQGKPTDEILGEMASRSGGTAAALAVIFRTVRPEAPLADFEAYAQAHMKPRLWDRLDAEARQAIYDKHARDAFDLQDRGYIASVHPLELWAAQWREAHPEGELSALLAESGAAVAESYRWLYGPTQGRAQKNRIKQVLEQRAFERLHRRWVKLGFPFDSLVPSYATALGSSGDRPESLATLAGILSAEGVRHPMSRVNRMHFAADTPYDMVVDFPGRAGQRVLSPDVARAALEAMEGVVRRGTGKALKGAFGGGALKLRAKTGTGDNRNRRTDKRGRVLSETVHSRTATVVFTLGDRWFGTMTAVVTGSHAGAHEYTSGLVAQALSRMAPTLLPALRSEQKPPKVSEGLAP